MQRMGAAVLICAIAIYSVTAVPFADGSLRALAAAETAKKPVNKKAERDRMLCRALQACRDGFKACKGKIEYPDQSEAWSIAKEECGAHYKACVEKDFRGGEWFFTRWFYFRKLKCE